MERRQGYADTTSGAWGTYGGSAATTVHDCSSAERGIYGTPKNQNWVASNPITPTPTATKYKKPTPVVPTPFAHMVINEFLPRAGTDWNHDGKVDVYDEFIEVKNLGPIDVDLEELETGRRRERGPDALHADRPQAKHRGACRLLRVDDEAAAGRQRRHGALDQPGGVVIDARGYGPVADPDQSSLPPSGRILLEASVLSDARAREFPHRGSAVRTAGGRSRSASMSAGGYRPRRRSVKRSATGTGRTCGIRRTGTSRPATAKFRVPD